MWDGVGAMKDMTYLDTSTPSKGLDSTFQDRYQTLEPETERCITILYATETGNAEEVAERIARIAYRRHIRAHLKSLELYDKV